MGLDITAYSKLEKLDCVFDADGEPINPVTREPVEGYFQAHISRDFPKQGDGLTDRAVYSYEKSEGFRAGSYSGYNAWRERLAELAGYPAEPSERDGKGLRHDEGAWSAKGGPFHELINFSDCEGDIGPVISAKLAKDFADFQDRADAIMDHDGYWRDKYASWRRAFEMAAQNGAVSFH